MSVLLRSLLVVVSAFVISVFLLFNSSVVGSVFAGCSGTIYCGTMTLGRCSYDNSVCSTTKCGPGQLYSCSLGTVCDNYAKPTACSKWTDEYTCIHATVINSCVGGCSNVLPNCTWTPPCTTTAWTNGPCFDGNCVGATPRRQYRTVTPAGCTNSTRCIADASCVATVNGVCGATHYNCSAGTSANNVSGATTWTWNCNGSGGGSNASCSETKACTITSTPTCNALGTQISTVWNVSSKNFTINQVEGRFNKTPYTDWPTGPGDQSLNWGTGTSGTSVANITGNTDYSTSVAVYDVAPNAARSNYICRSASTNPNCPIPSCTLSLAAIPSTIAIGDASALSATVTPTGGTISKVDFSEAGGHTTPASITDNSSPFSYLAMGASSGISTVTAKATMNNGVTTCSGSAIINVTFRGPWWQVKDGDVTTNGNLSSSIPPTAGLYFDLAGAGGYPGIPAYAGTTNLTGGNVSVAKWIANSGYTSTKIFDSNYFLNAIPSDGVINNLASSIDQTSIDMGVADPSGVYYFEYDSTKNAGTDLTIASAINIGAKKVILIAKNSDVYVKGRINLTRGQGFFLLVAGKDAGGIRGNIIIDPSVGGGAGANLEGIYVADSQFRTGIAATQLWLRGTVASYGGASLQRDLGAANSTTPAELFEYAPDQELLFPSRLANHAMTWQEVAP